MAVREYKKSKTSVQWMVGIVANSICFVYGLQTGWISPMAKVLQSDSSPLGAPISDYTLGGILSILPIAALVFVPFFACLADTFGRRTGLLIMTLLQTASWLLKMISPSTTTLVLARVACGIAAGGCFTIIPMYNNEISQDSIRGLIGALLIVFYNLGILTIHALGAYLDYYTVLYIVVGVPIVVFFLLLMCPESPGYLVMTGKIEDATQKLAMLRGLEVDDKAILSEMQPMRERDEYYKSLPSHSVFDILKDKAWRRACLLGTILVSVQAFSGTYALVSYAANILAASGGTMNPELQSFSFPAIMMIGAILSMCVIEKVGRRVILLTAYLISAAALAALAVIQQLPQGTVPSWLMLLAIAVATIAHAAGIMPMPYIVMTEIFNIQIRAKMMGVAVSIAWIMSFLQLATFAPIKDTLGLDANFYFHTLIHLVGVAAVVILMPETRGKSIEQVELELRNK